MLGLATPKRTLVWCRHKPLESSTTMTVRPLHVNDITIAPQAEIRLGDLQPPIASGEYKRELFEYGRLTQYRVRGRRK